MGVEHVRALFAGPIDVVGDIHGEYEPLRSLLGFLGYSSCGEHSQGRRLVFVGDLVDRGPDSVAVVEWVQRLVARDLAQCVLGNHELNLLRGARKDGNGWFFAKDHDRTAHKYSTSRQASDAERRFILAFCEQLPVALQRPDLRVTHACWDAGALEAIVADPRDTLAIYNAYADALKAQALQSGLKAKADAEEAQYGAAILEEKTAVELLKYSGLEDELYQMGNPLRIITSGPEKLAVKPFFASGKWRMLDRVRWWEDYQHPVPVIFGHYWRAWEPTDCGVPGHPKRDVFPGKQPSDWVSRQNAFCADFSIGARFRERRDHPGGPYKTRLAAVRWPERQLFTDRGERRSLGAE
ncbi:MAG: metallophosphoesterase [Steroidobacteraceae bacterium]